MKGRVYDRIRHYHILGNFPIMQSRQHQLPQLVLCFRYCDCQHPGIAFLSPNLSRIGIKQVKQVRRFPCRRQKTANRQADRETYQQYGTASHETRWEGPNPAEI